jgi:hypothetical protein
MLTINPEQVCFLIVKARQFDVKEAPTEQDGSNATDERFRSVLADTPDDAVQTELRDAIRGLNVDEQCDLVALAWLGRGDFPTWDEAVAMARERHTGRTAEYLMSLPLLGDYLEEGLSVLGYSCEAAERAHL